MYGKYECFVMQMVYICVLCASCGSSQCDMQFVNTGRECSRRPYGRGILQGPTRYCLHEVGLLKTSAQIVSTQSVPPEMRARSRPTRFLQDLEAIKVT